MTDLSLDKIKNMLGAHNDGVFRLNAREDMGEIVGWLLDEMEAAMQDIEWLQDSRHDAQQEAELYRVALLAILNESRKRDSNVMTIQRVALDALNGREP